jgi:nitrogen-specific signal transduction histidine kinase
VADTLEQVAPLAEDRRIRLHSEYAAGLPPLQADGARLRQALRYLVSNAVEMTGEGTVTVGARRIGQNGRQVAISVAAGVDAPWINGSRIDTTGFDALPDQNLVWDGTNTGIKLILSKRIIELHGGCLWMRHDTAPEVGYLFTLPLSAGGGDEKPEGGL